MDARLEFAIQKGRDMGFVKNGSHVIFVCGWQPGAAATNSMRILHVQGNQVVGKNQEEYVFCK